MYRSQITGPIKPWLLRNAGETVEICPPAATIVHDLASQIELTVRRLGILSAPASSVSDHVGAGRLTRMVIADGGLFLFFPDRRHHSAALHAFVAFLKGRSQQ